MGRSRGGLTTKVHALVEADGLPVALKLSEGQAHDGRTASDMFDTVKAGHILLADRAYDCDALRDALASLCSGCRMSCHALGQSHSARDADVCRPTRPARVSRSPACRWVRRATSTQGAMTFSLPRSRIGQCRRNRAPGPFET